MWSLMSNEDTPAKKRLIETIDITEEDPENPYELPEMEIVVIRGRLPIRRTCTLDFDEMIKSGRFRDFVTISDSDTELDEADDDLVVVDSSSDEEKYKPTFTHDSENSDNPYNSDILDSELSSDEEKYKPDPIRPRLICDDSDDSDIMVVEIA